MRRLAALVLVAGCAVQAVPFPLEERDVELQVTAEGKPLSEASVYVPSPPGPNVLRAAPRTNDAGCVRLELYRPSERLVVSAPGRASTRLTIEQGSSAVVELEPEAPVTLHLVGELGRPFRGARLLFTDADDPALTVEADDGLYAIHGLRAGESCEVLADDLEGRFAPRRFRVTAPASGLRIAVTPTAGVIVRIPEPVRPRR